MWRKTSFRCHIIRTAENAFALRVLGKLRWPSTKATSWSTACPRSIHARAKEKRRVNGFGGGTLCALV